MWKTDHVSASILMTSDFGRLWQNYYTDIFVLAKLLFSREFSQNKCKTRANAHKVAAFQNFSVFSPIFLRKLTDLVIFQENGNVLKIFLRMTIC